MMRKTFLYVALALMPMTTLAQQNAPVSQQVKTADPQPTLCFGILGSIRSFIPCLVMR